MANEKYFYTYKDLNFVKGESNQMKNIRITCGCSENWRESAGIKEHTHKNK